MQAFISRRVSSHIRELAAFFPIISLTGPRQAGKTTLLKELFTDYRYISFEDPNNRESFNDDPIGFLENYASKVIFDEAQRVPELFSYLQSRVDADRTPARYVLSGSQNFLLLENISQSLAGRVGVVRLLPLGFNELSPLDLLPKSPAEAIVRGAYPELYQTDLPSAFFYPNYVSTYLERDVTHLVQSGNMSDFRRFMTLCAAMVGQTLNYSALANSLDISVPTVKTWFHYLEQSFLAFRVSPYFSNFGKRLVKSPKLYFYDTGLLCYLLQIEDANTVKNSPLYGSLFENLIFSEVIKNRFNAGNQHPIYFYRDNRQLEVDLVEEKAGTLHLTEIKASMTPRTRMAQNLHQVAEMSKKPSVKRIIYGGAEKVKLDQVEFLPWNKFNPTL